VRGIAARVQGTHGLAVDLLLAEDQPRDETGGDQASLNLALDVRREEGLHAAVRAVEVGHGHKALLFGLLIPHELVVQGSATLGPLVNRVHADVLHRVAVLRQEAGLAGFHQFRRRRRLFRKVHRRGLAVLGTGLRVERSVNLLRLQDRLREFNRLGHCTSSFRLLLGEELQLAGCVAVLAHRDRELVVRRV